MLVPSSASGPATLDSRTRMPEPWNPPGTGAIDTAADIRAGVQALRSKCSAMRRVHDATGDPPLRRRPAGYEGLSRIVVAQQLSTASANAIWSRLIAAIAPLRADVLLQAGEDPLRGAGLSRTKIKTLRAIATAIVHEDLHLERLAGESDEAVHEALTRVSGIGPWTADVFLMFCLGRRDAFAAGDLALQVAAQKALGLGYRPRAPELLDLAERWRPWRGVAARLLWSYYRLVKEPRSGAPV
jgi:DNA-3-methyladenine glycosylase II